jgi:hypothetical protein
MKMMRIGAFSASALLALGAASAVAEQAPAYDVRAAFLEADRNGDNAIEIDEFYERLVDVYFLGDTNKNGFLEKDEFVRVVVINENFEKIDRDGDGKLSRKEFVAGRLPMFLQIDSDDDGSLSITEVTVAYEAKPAK